MKGLTIQVEQLGRIARAQEARARAVEADPEGGGSVMRYVSPEVIASTKERYPSCRCENLGLEAGMPVTALREIEEGCTGSRQRNAMSVSGAGWVCERLNSVRRAYGK